jgi:hypothetical protein
MAASSKVPHLNVDERRARGEEARDRTPPATPDGYRPPTPTRPGGLAEEQNVTDEPDLVAVRHGRMLVSPFTFHRGTAKIMAADLAATHTAGP